jgi:hypothetical protein
MSDEWAKDAFRWAKHKEGIIWTEFEKCKNVLQLYLKADFLETETVLLYEGGNTRTYYKLHVKDMWSAYAVMYQTLLSIW